MIKINRRPTITDTNALSSVPEFLRSVLINRGIRSATQLDKRLQAMQSFDSLIDINKAVARLVMALQNQEKIIIIGDFDADGATSTTLAVSALQSFGAKEIDFMVPNRFEYGYGLSPEIVDEAAKKNPKLIITVDNGISCINGVNRANSLGIEVIITDHHLAGEELPNAFAIVNPNQPGAPFPPKSTARVGVIFYVMMALRRALINIQWFEQQGLKEPVMAQFLDLVALGTVADVVTLDKNNRIMVSQGLQRIRGGRVRPGIKALLEISGRVLANIRETDLGFAVAPRLNAAGRLDDMSLGIACLLSDDQEQANQRASHLDELNIERRKIESEMKEQAFDFIDQLLNKLPEGSKLPLALCMVDDSWHQGVIGILAGRLKEQFHRPVIIFAKVSESEMKGSARSINGLNIRDVLANIDKDFPGMINKFGGHAMAAGLSIHPSQFSGFKEALVIEVSQHINQQQCEGALLSDGELAADMLNLQTAQLIQEYGPWGQHFAEPVFDGVFEVIEQRIVGQNHLKLSLMHPVQKIRLDAIAFNIDLKQWPNHRARHIHVAYKLDINIYQGRSKLQLMVEALYPHTVEHKTLELSEELAEYSW